MVRATSWTGNPTNPYILVRRDYSCDGGALPASMIQGNQSWKFSLIRDATCDHSFADIKDIVQMNPAGEAYRIPIMKRVAGVEGDKMPTTETFTCYRLTRKLTFSPRRKSRDDLRSGN